MPAHAYSLSVRGGPKMMLNMRNIAKSLVFIAVLGWAYTFNAQCPVMPAGTICLTQQQANQAAENARLIPALEGKITALEDGLKLKDVSIAELKATNAQNVASLTERMHRTEVQLAEKTGNLIGIEAALVRTDARLEQCMKKRSVKVGLFNIN
jgi:hypothetical protein